MSKIKKEAMEQLRKTRAKLLREHPERMAEIQAMLEAQQQPVRDAGDVGDVSKEKNISTVLKSLELRDGDAPFNAAVKAMLAKHMH